VEFSLLGNIGYDILRDRAKLITNGAEWAAIIPPGKKI